jgi:3-oxoacyl-[acyl-carrier protein] reductase
MTTTTDDLARSYAGCLSGRTALVTGAASGIGRAIALHFAAAGARVVLADRDPAVHSIAEAMSSEGSATGIEFDARSEESITAAVAQATSTLGRIDTLVTSHGILTEHTLDGMELSQWNDVLTVDLTSVFLLCREVLPGMLDREDGRIVNVASQLGQKGGTGMSHYAAAKAGVIAMTKSLAHEVSPRGVLANCIAPGPIDTPMVAGISEDWKRNKRAELPLRRFGQVDEVAPTAVMLATSPFGDLYVGQTLGPNSGDVML